MGDNESGLHPQENQFLATLQQDIDRLILLCWDGHRLKDEDKKQFRHMVRFNRGQWIFINLLNQFRIKNIHSMNSDQAILSISELIKIVLDEIFGVVDTYVAVYCLLLSSTFYFNTATLGGVNQKKYLFELISDHRIWHDIDFWERAITCMPSFIILIPYRVNPKGLESAFADGE